jgi:hypothetical protein
VQTSPVCPSNVSLCTIFVICPILHKYCTCWASMRIHFFILDNIFIMCWMHCYIIHLYLILLQMFSKPHTKFVDIFLFILIFSPTFPRLRLKPTGKPARFIKFRNFYQDNCCRTENWRASWFRFAQFRKSNFWPKTGCFNRFFTGSNDIVSPGSQWVMQ